MVWVGVRKITFHRLSVIMKKKENLLERERKILRVLALEIEDSVLWVKEENF